MASHARNDRILRLGNRSRRPRLFLDRSNPLEVYSAEEVFRRFRFWPETIMYIMSMLTVTESKTNRNCPVPPLLQLLCCLRYLATGSLHLVIGDTLSMSRSTAGRCIRKITYLLAKLAKDTIQFPTGRDADNGRSQFASIANFPNVLGCIDGTLIPIRKPKSNEGDFVCRKGYHALNVQMSCNANFMVTSCNASWPGSVHDSRAFRCSALCRNFEEGTHNGFLLGDSGYPCRHFLLTPFVNPVTEAEISYNLSLCRTRVLIEQTFGILKRRFQVLHSNMQTTAERAVIYTVACVVLHNIGIRRGDIINVEDVIIEDTVPNIVNDTQDGTLMRRHIVDTFFS